MKDDIWNDDAERQANRPWVGCGVFAFAVMVLALVLALVELFK